MASDERMRESENGKQNLVRALGLTDLVLFNIVAIVGLRWVAAAARMGPSSILLWILALVFFFIPQGLVVSTLSRRYPEEGGLYVWTKRAFGSFHGFLGGWCYCANNLVYYPSLLFYVSSVAAYIGGEKYVWLGDNKYFVTSVACLLLWIAILTNVVGLRTGKWIQNAGGALGTWLPGMLLIALGLMAWRRYGSANAFDMNSMIPNSGDLGTLTFWSQIIFAFAGLELAPVMGEEIRNPRVNIPRAIVISGLVITSIYILGTASVLVAVPTREVNFITGSLQSVMAVAKRVELAFLSSLVALLITVGGLGGTGAWLAGSARIPFVAGLDRFLPNAFGRLHPRWKTPYVALVSQGAIATVFIMTSVIGATVREAYLIMVDMTIVVYFIPYLYLFAAAIALRRHKAGNAGREEGEVPGEQAGVFISSIAGLVMTLLAIGMAFIPSSDIKQVFTFELKLIGGCLAFLTSGILIFYYSSQKSKRK